MTSISKAFPRTWKTTLSWLSVPQVNHDTIKKEYYTFIVNNVIINMGGYIFILHTLFLSSGYILKRVESLYSYTSSNFAMFLKF